MKDKHDKEPKRAEIAARPPDIRARAIKRDLAVAAALLLLFILLLHGALFSPDPLVAGDPLGDGATQFYPWRVFGFGEWASNRLPLWNPYVLMGMPFVASLQSAMLYPPNWLFMAMPAHHAANITILLHLFLSSIFTYMLARQFKVSPAGAFAAAVTFTLAANHSFRIYQGHWNHISAMPWLPLLLLSVEMLSQTGKLRYIALGAGALGMQMLAANPQLTYYSCLFAAIYLLLRIFTAWLDLNANIRQCIARCSGFVFVIAGGLLLAAAQLIPAWKLTSVSSRSEYITFEWLTQYSLPPENLLTMLAPNLFGPVFAGGRELLPYWGRWNFWEVGAYMGIISLTLAGAAVFRADRRKWLPFALPSAILMFIALSRYMPFAEWVFQIAPGLRLFRAHGRAVSIAAMGLAMMSGMGLDALVSACRSRNRDAAWGFLILTGIAAALTIAAFASGDLPEFWRRFFLRNMELSERVYLSMPEAPDMNFAARTWFFARWGIARSAGMMVAVSVLLALAMRGLLKVRWLGAGIAVIVAADLYLFAAPFMFTFDARDRIWDENTRDQLSAVEEPFRVSNRDDWYRYACDPMIFRIASLEAIEPNVPARFHEFFWTMQGMSPETVRTVYALRQRDAPLLDLVNLRYIVMRDPGGAYRIVERPNAMPRAFLVHEYVRAEHRYEALSLLQRLDFRRAAVLEEEPAMVIPYHPDNPEPPVEGVEARIESYEPMRARIRAKTPQPALLVLSDLYYRGWRASINGRPAPILQTNFLMRGVELPPGEHLVEFEYRPRSFTAAKLISLITWATLALAILVIIVADLSRRQHVKYSQTGTDKI